MTWLAPRLTPAVAGDARPCIASIPNTTTTRTATRAPVLPCRGRAPERVMAMVIALHRIHAPTAPRLRCERRPPFALSVRGEPTRLVDGEDRGAEQDQQADAGVDHVGGIPQRGEVGGRQACLGRYGCVRVDRLRVSEQDGGGEQVEYEFEQHPVVPKQPPC